MSALETRPRTLALALCGVMTLASGCTSLKQWHQNGFKVGPEFRPPEAAVAPTWIDSGNPRIAAVRPDPAWWLLLNDPILTDLINAASRDNLDLKTAGTRVLQAQYQRNFDAGQLFPQTQSLTGLSAHAQIGPNLLSTTGSGGATSAGSSFSTRSNTFLNANLIGFNASWELDFWGRYRRMLESDDANLAASLDGVADALVMLTAEVATDYIQVRTAQGRLRYARENIEAQRGSLKIAMDRRTEGRDSGVDVAQAEENLAKTEANVPPIELALRQANNRLSLALGRPPADLYPCLGDRPIPTAPPTVAIGIPAHLLERRPDVRGALRDAAAQSALIGVAEADFYPSIGVTGYIGYGNTDITRFLSTKSLLGYVIPNFQWKILNYGRVLNTVRLQEALFQEKVVTYQKKVLTAGQEAENAIAGFLQYQLQIEAQERAVAAAEKAANLALIQYKEGRSDFNRLFTVQADLASQQDALATARGNVVTNLVSIYKAIGGGWEAFCQQKNPTSADIRLQSSTTASVPPVVAPAAPPDLSPTSRQLGTWPATAVPPPAVEAPGPWAGILPGPTADRRAAGGPGLGPSSASSGPGQMTIDPLPDPR